MLVNGGVEIGAEPVGGGPELLVEVAEELLGGAAGHDERVGDLANPGTGHHSRDRGEIVSGENRSFLRAIPWTFDRSRREGTLEDRSAENRSLSGRPAGSDDTQSSWIEAQPSINRMAAGSLPKPDCDRPQRAIAQRCGHLEVSVIPASHLLKHGCVILSALIKNLGRTPRKALEQARPEAPRAPRNHRAAFTLVEVMVAGVLLVLTAVTVTQALLQLNRQAAISRVKNAAKAEALSRIQQVSQCAYSPDALPAVIPTILNIGTTTQAIDLGSTLTDLGSIPGTATWAVSTVAGTAKILSVRSTITYKYFGKSQSYELFTYKSPD